MTKIQEALDALEKVHALDAIKRSITAAYASGYAAGKKPRQWVGLTDEDCAEVERWVEFKEEGSDRIQTSKLIRYIEEKLRKKNHDAN